MTIGAAETFHYHARIGPADFDAKEFTLQASVAPGRVGPSLAGPAPRLRFWDEKIVLIAGPGNGDVKWVNFRIGDVLTYVAEPGDTVEVRGGLFRALALVLRREGRLVIGVGAVQGMLRGEEIAMRAETETGDVEFRVGEMRVLLGPRDSAIVGPFDVYVEHGQQFHPGGRPACVAIVPATADKLVINAARRSVVLMASQRDPLRGEQTDGTYLRERKGV